MSAYEQVSMAKLLDDAIDLLWEKKQFNVTPCVNTTQRESIAKEAKSILEELAKQ